MAISTLNVTAPNWLIDFSYKDTTSSVFTGTRSGTFGRGSILSNGAPAITLTYGTGASEANAIYQTQATLAASGNDDYDLSGTLEDGLGNTVTFTYVKAIICTIDTPGSTKYLRIGPQGVTNTFVGPFGDASDYEQFYDFCVKSNPYTGWAVTAGTADIFRVHNPSAVSVTYNLVIVGLD